MKLTKHKMSNFFLLEFVTEEILMNNELVEAAFTSDMDNDNSPKYIKNIMIKLGKYVMIFHISNLSNLCCLKSLIYVDLLMQKLSIHFSPPL